MALIPNPLETSVLCLAQRDSIVPPARGLSQVLQDFEVAAGAKQWKEYQDLAVDLENGMKGFLKSREPTAASSKHSSPLRDKLKRAGASVNNGITKFSEVALHYQEIFDVLNSQAPEYTTVAWGAIKLLLLFTVNGAEITRNITSTLEKLGHELKILKVITEVRPTAAIIAAVTSTYVEFLSFLKEAVKCYGENSFKRWAKRLTQPWELRFQPILDRIQEKIDLLWKTVHTSHLLLTTSLEEWVKENGKLLDEILTVGHQIMGRQNSLLFQMARLRSEQSQNYQEILNSVLEQRNLTTSDRSCNGSSTAMYEITYEEDQDRTLLSDLLEAHDGTQPGWLNPIVQVFPHVKSLESFETERIQKYVGFASLDSFGLANVEGSREVHDWAKSDESSLMWVDGWREKGVFDWTTMFSMEISAAAAATDNQTRLDKQDNLSRTGAGIATCLPFFCTADSELLMLYGPLLLIQMWIVRLIQIRKSDFDIDACRKKGLYVERFKQAAMDTKSLIDVFKDCVDVVRSTCFYLIIDNIDVLYNLCAKPSPTPVYHDADYSDGEFQTDFQLLLSCLKELSQSTAYQIKVLVTSRVPLVSAALFESEQPKTDSNRHRLVKILRQEHKNVRSTPNRRRRHRVSIRKEGKLTDVEQQRLLHGLEHNISSESDTEPNLIATNQDIIGGTDSDDSDEELKRIRVVGMLNRQDSSFTNGSAATRTDPENDFSDDNDIIQLIRKNNDARQTQQQAHLNRILSDPIDGKSQVEGEIEKNKETHNTTVKGETVETEDDDDDLMAMLKAKDTARAKHVKPAGLVKTTTEQERSPKLTKQTLDKLFKDTEDEKQDK